MTMEKPNVMMVLEAITKQVLHGDPLLSLAMIAMVVGEEVEEEVAEELVQPTASKLLFHSS